MEIDASLRYVPSILRFRGADADQLNGNLPICVTNNSKGPLSISLKIPVFKLLFWGQYGVLVTLSGSFCSGVMVQMCVSGN